MTGTSAPSLPGVPTSLALTYLPCLGINIMKLLRALLAPPLQALMISDACFLGRNALSAVNLCIQ